jgi:hypothetical protein
MLFSFSTGNEPLLAQMSAVLQNYLRAQKVASRSFSGGNLKQRSNEFRLTNRITSS